MLRSAWVIAQNAGMPITLPPPSPGPGVVIFTNVPLGGTSLSSAAHLIHTNESLYARIEGDANGVFSVDGLETDAYQHDPDLPAGQKMWDPVDVVQGAGPVMARSGEAVRVSVMFRAITSLTEPELTATVVLASSPNGPAVLSIPITATLDFLGSVQIETQSCALVTSGIDPGQTESMLVRFTSTAVKDVSGTFTLKPGSTTAFTSGSVRLTVPAQSFIDVWLPVSCVIGAVAGTAQNVPFQFTADDSRYTTTLDVNIDVVFPALASNSNYFLDEGGNSILGLSVKVRIDTELVSSSNGWSMQLNGYSPSGNTNGWQQYVVYASPGDSQLWARIDNWDNSLNELIRADVQLATLPTATVPTGYTIAITLINDADGNITGATYAVNNLAGTSVGTATLAIVGQTLRTTGKPAMTADQAPIEAFQFNIVGDYGSARATLTSGSGWISYSASKALSLVSAVPAYVNNQNVITAETANLTYGDQPSTSVLGVDQPFQLTSALVPHLRARVEARELSLVGVGHALPPPEHITQADSQ